tara:strand:+ start:25 stop:360 length:336 start_codon:yes stop_codon:yes gene_type:complete
MSLIVDFTRIDESAKKELNQYQEMIGYYMMAIGMGEITQDNHLEVYARLVLLNASSLSTDEPWMTLEVVKALIGAEFNIAFESKAKFSSRMMKATLREVERQEAKEVQDVA